MPPAIAVKVMAVRCCPNSTIATSTPLHAPQIQAHHVRAAEGVTHQRLEYCAADAKRCANQDRHRHARQSPFGDHHGDVTRRAASMRA